MLEIKESTKKLLDAMEPNQKFSNPESLVKALNSAVLQEQNNSDSQPNPDSR